LAAGAFIAAYILTIGVLTFVNVVVFRFADAKFLSASFRAWWEIYWPLWTIFYAPAAIAALLAAWSSGLQGRATSLLLCLFLALIVVAMEPSYLYDAQGPQLLIELLLLAGIFVVVAQVCRVWRTRN
jgi:hypothetical protein